MKINFLKTLAPAFIFAVVSAASAQNPPTATPTPAQAPVAATPPQTPVAAQPIGKKLASKATAGAKDLAPGEKVNVNTATLADLEKLPGIGEAKAQAIISARPIKTTDDLMKIKGIKQGVFAKIKDHITL